MRIEARARRGHGIGRNPAGRLRVAVLRDAIADRIEQLLRSWTIVRPTTRHAVIAVVSGGGGTWVKKSLSREVLPDDLRADDFAIAHDQRAVCLVAERGLTDGPHRERID